MPITGEIRDANRRGNIRPARVPTVDLRREEVRADRPAQVVGAPTWKRCLDLSLIALALPVLLPVAAAVSAWIKFVSRGPVLFRQERVGTNGQRFTIFKFRSMEQNAATGTHENYVQDLFKSDRPMTKLDAMGDARIIRGGNLLRATGLDELPQLLNVLRGEMSLVGPRPCLPSELEAYSEEQRERFHTAPGLTGYWQVNGKNQTTFTEMIALDVHYVRHRSLGLDLWVLAKTPVAIVSQCLGNRAAKRRGSNPGA